MDQPDKVANPARGQLNREKRASSPQGSSSYVCTYGWVILCLYPTPFYLEIAPIALLVLVILS